MDPVGLTSRWVAAARARESERADRLFDDPLAAAFAGPEGFAWLDRLEPVTLPGTPGPGLGPGLYVTVRTRFFDDFLVGASRSIGTRQVVLVAAGMDARAFRLDWSPGTRLYELDRPEVLPLRTPSRITRESNPPASGTRSGWTWSNPGRRLCSMPAMRCRSRPFG